MKGNGFVRLRDDIMAAPGVGPRAFFRNVVVCYLLRAVDQEWDDLTIAQLSKWTRLSTRAIREHLRFLAMTWDTLQEPILSKVTTDDEVKSMLPKVGLLIKDLIDNPTRERNSDGTFRTVVMERNVSPNGTKRTTNYTTRRLLDETKSTVEESNEPYLVKSEEKTDVVVVVDDDDKDILEENRPERGQAKDEETHTQSRSSDRPESPAKGDEGDDWGRTMTSIFGPPTMSVDEMLKESK